MTNTGKKFLIRHARIVTPAKAIEADLLIESGRIAEVVAPSDKSWTDTGVLDLHGLTLFPGFIDIHIHGAVGVDTMEASAAELQRVGEFLARNGVTSWLPTLVPAPQEQYEEAVKAIGELVTAQRKTVASAELNAHKMSALPARVLGVHYEGPFVNSEQCGALHREHFRTFKSIEDIDTLPNIAATGAIHLMTLAPEVDGGIQLIEALKKRGWIVSIGHTQANTAVLDQALEAGAHHMTHFMNAMTPLHHRSVGAVGWGLVHDDVTCDIIADGIHIDRDILKLIVDTKSVDRLSLISDAIAAAGQGDGECDIWGETISVKNGRTQNARGSIAGSVITMLEAVRMMLSLGFSELEVARMASLNPAGLLGIDHDCGSIEEGKRADLVAVDSDLKVRLTIIGGQIAFQS